jgi:thiamine biosynthesis protein ThiS
MNVRGSGPCIGARRAALQVAQLAQHQGLTLTCRDTARYAQAILAAASLFITLNGEPHELDGPLSIADLLTKLSIDPRRVAVEHNYTIVRRPLFADTPVQDGDRVEIVNFVGGG